MAIERKDEVLDKALQTDQSVIPRFDIVLPNGLKVAENAQIVLKNPVLQEGMPINKEAMDECLSASGVTYQVTNCVPNSNFETATGWTIANGILYFDTSLNKNAVGFEAGVGELYMAQRAVKTFPLNNLLYVKTHAINLQAGVVRNVDYVNPAYTGPETDFITNAGGVGWHWSSGLAANANADCGIIRSFGYGVPLTTSHPWQCSVSNIKMYDVNHCRKLNGSVVDKAWCDAYIDHNVDGAQLILEQPNFVLFDGAVIRFKLTSDSGATPTLNVNGTGAKPIMQTKYKPMKAGLAAGTWLTAVYSSTFDFFLLQGSGSVSTGRYGNDIGQISSYELFTIGHCDPFYSRNF